MEEFKECKCLPGKERDAILFAVEDKAFDYEEKAKKMNHEIGKYPNRAKEHDDWISKNDQYQKGLVTARDLTNDYFSSNIVFRELELTAEYYRELASKIRDVPYCGWEYIKK